jgi:hypothetical protein
MEFTLSNLKSSDGKVSVIPSQINYAGNSIGTYAGEAWNHELSLLPKAGKAKPNENNDGPVFHLHPVKFIHSGEEREKILVDASSPVEIKKETPVLIDLIHFYAVEGEDGPDDPSLRYIVRELAETIDKSTLKLEINGKSIPGLNLSEAYVESMGFHLTTPIGALDEKRYHIGDQTYSLPANAAYGKLAVAAGYYVLLKFEAGRYTIVFDGKSPLYNFETMSKYILEVT